MPVDIASGLTMLRSVGPVDLTEGTLGDSDETIPTGQWIVIPSCSLS